MTTPDTADLRPEVLLLRTLKLGDLLVAVPAIHAVRRALPGHRLVLAMPGWLEPVTRLVGGVDALLPTPGLDDPLPLPPGRIDTAINLHGRGPESDSLIALLEPRHTIGHSTAGFGGPEWRDGMLERARWARLVEAHGMPADPDDVALEGVTPPAPVDDAVVVHVGAFYGSRRWPAERFAKVAEALRGDGHRIIFTGSEAERPRAEEVARLGGFGPESVSAGRLALDEFAAVVKSARLVVSADTGAAHLASAYGIPSVVLFGPAPPEEWGPPASGPHVVLTDARQRRGDAFADAPDPAILAVQVADVLAAGRSLLADSAARRAGTARG
ncbi:glycosyl transferase [Subtercola sp. Z020]|uniref:glycosyltransferase family 9 protein n=1 Tax=Subtercola sp. Z020 TaxID=2080582 RepID=UPI000CE73970|nr:glycosyltransferase family 9 protein [Subtercola sp. Z020]PPF87841.1 glycosyl transferase [Subtercola sp. Z020]